VHEKKQIVKKTKTKKLLFSKNKEKVIFKNHEKAGKRKAREMRMKKLRLSITRSLGGLFGKVYSS
jgi:hypothetical protein